MRRCGTLNSPRQKSGWRWSASNDKALKLGGFPLSRWECYYGCIWIVGWLYNTTSRERPVFTFFLNPLLIHSASVTSVLARAMHHPRCWGYRDGQVMWHSPQGTQSRDKHLTSKQASAPLAMCGHESHKGKGCELCKANGVPV